MLHKPPQVVQKRSGALRRERALVLPREPRVLQGFPVLLAVQINSFALPVTGTLEKSGLIGKTTVDLALTMKSGAG